MTGKGLQEPVTNPDQTLRNGPTLNPKPFNNPAIDHSEEPRVLDVSEGGEKIAADELSPDSLTKRVWCLGPGLRPVSNS